MQSAPLAPSARPSTTTHPSTRATRRALQRATLADLDKAVSRSSDPLMRWMWETVQECLEINEPQVIPHLSLLWDSAECGDVGTGTDHPPHLGFDASA